MKIREVLKHVGMSEQVYYGLVRQNALPFMRNRLKGQSNFRREHLLAMKAFALLRGYRVSSTVAGLAVKAAFPAICEFCVEGKLASREAYKLGADYFTLNGKLRAIPLRDLPPPGAQELGRVELDLRGIAALLPWSELAREAGPVTDAAGSRL